MRKLNILECKRVSYDKIAYFQCCIHTNVDICNVVWRYMPMHWTHKNVLDTIHNAMKSLNVLLSRVLEINEISEIYEKYTSSY